MGLFRRNEELVYRQEGLERFVKAQKRDYQLALEEIRAGKKQSHWIWYIFPQMYGLGHSCYANLYGIRDKKEAEEYLRHKVLGKRLREITRALLEHDGCSADEIFGNLDAMKVRSCITLFDVISPDDIFAEVLKKFYDGNHCSPTIILLYDFADICKSIKYIGVDGNDFNLDTSMFSRPVVSSIHGIGHIYRTMIGCALLGRILQKPREGLLAFCGAYMHDLARETDGIEPDHGEKAITYCFDRYNYLWDKYGLPAEERTFVKEAVIQHSKAETLEREDEGYDVMAILKDADALDRCRFGDLNPSWLRYSESRYLITLLENIYKETRHVDGDISFVDFIAACNKL